MKTTYGLPKDFLHFLKSGKEIPEDQWPEPNIKLNREEYVEYTYKFHPYFLESLYGADTENMDKGYYPIKYICIADYEETLVWYPELKCFGQIDKEHDFIVAFKNVAWKKLYEKLKYYLNSIYDQNDEYILNFEETDIEYVSIGLISLPELMTQARKEYHEARKLRALEKYDEALKKLKASIKIYPEIAKVHLTMGNIFFHDKINYKKALKSYNKAIEIDSEMIDAYINRGVCLLNLGKTDKALKNNLKAIKVDPKSALAYSNVAYTLAFHKGKYKKSLPYWQKTIELAPQTPRWRMNRAIVFMNLLDFESAEKDFEKAISLGIQSSDTFVNYAECLLISGKMDKIIPLFKKAKIKESTISDQAMELMFRHIVDYLSNNKKTTKLDKFLQKDFKVAWGFSELDSWLKRAPLTDEQKSYLNEVFNKLKVKN